MKNISEIAFIIPVHLYSTRIPLKMTRPFNETTLLDIAIKKLTNSKIIPKENIYIACHEPELKEIVKKYNVNIFDRSYISANSEGFDVREIYEWWDKLPSNFKYYMHLNACQPLLTTKTIDNFVTQFINSNSRCIITALNKKNYFWNEDGSMDTHNFIDSNFKQIFFNTKYVKPTYEASHTMYIGVLEDIGKGIWLGTFKKNDPELFFIEEKEVFDIDYLWQFEIAELIHKILNTN